MRCAGNRRYFRQCAADVTGDVFWVLAGDVFMLCFEFVLAAVARFVASGQLAHLWLVPNPAHEKRTKTPTTFCHGEQQTPKSD
jgi:hypothetical protein